MVHVLCQLFGYSLELTTAKWWQRETILSGVFIESYRHIICFDFQASFHWVDFLCMDTGNPCGSPDRSLLFPIRSNRVTVKPLTPLVVASPMDVPTQPIGGVVATRLVTRWRVMNVMVYFDWIFLIYIKRHQHWRLWAKIGVGLRCGFCCICFFFGGGDSRNELRGLCGPDMSRWILFKQKMISENHLVEHQIPGSIGPSWQVRDTEKT